jgi:hypothetical protein
MAAYETHDFYCMNCGAKGIPISRRNGRQHEKFHRKVLYCPTCRQTVNHIECRNDQEVEDFKKNFENGVYKDEAEASMAYVRSTRLW